MRLLYFAILCVVSATVSHAAITSRVEKARTPGPRGVSLEDLLKDTKHFKQTPLRHKRATPANDTFSYTTALTNDNNGYALVHYSGAYSSRIFIVTQKFQNSRVVQSNLWRTTDYGRVYTNDTNKLPSNAIINHFYISLNKQKLILADQKNNKLYRTTNGGDTYDTTVVHFDPSTLEFHPLLEEAVLGYDEDHMELFISTDFGENWQQIDSKVHAYSWDPMADEPTVFYETDSDNATFLWKGSVTGGKLSKGVFDANLGGVEKNSLVLINDYIFVEKQLNLSDTSGEGGLFVSYKWAPFLEAVFPLKTQEQHYLIADASQGQALVAVYHFGNLTNLYLSDEAGRLYSMSLQNLKGSGISQWRSRTATVELVRIEGITGTYIANRLDPVSTTSYYYWPTFTQISYDKGGTWRFIRRPPYGADGRPNDNCTLSEDCNLNLRINQPSRQGVYSNTNALGLIVAHGNSGKYLNTYWWAQYFSNVYLSRDAGFTWTEEFNSGSYEYAFLDHGGVVVSVSRYSGYSVYTKSITYSCTEGLSWKQRDISDNSIYVIGMLTEPGSTTLEATVFAKAPGSFVEWLLVQMNFSELINRTCQQEDYVDWIPSDERQGGHCLLGERAVYERRKPEVCCFNGRSYDRPINTSTCPCKLQDFDCDVGYEKLSTDSPCTPTDDYVPEGAPIDCPEGDTYNRTLGYRLIPGDKCVGGDYHAYAPREYQCPIRAPTSLVLSTDSHFYRINQSVIIRLLQGFGSRVSTEYLWDYGDGETDLIIGYPESKSVSHSYSAAGVYTVVLSASNSAGVNNVSMRIVVLDEVATIQITGVTTLVAAGTTARYSLSAFSPAPDSHLLPLGTYKATWIVRLETEEVVSVEGQEFSYRLVTPGVYYITVEVSNDVTTKAVQEVYLVTVMGVPGSLSLSLLTDPDLFLSEHNIRLAFHQGTETDYTEYNVSFGDSSQQTGLNYSAAENLQHTYSAPGEYTVVVVAINIAGTQSVARDITIYDEVKSAVIKHPSILIVGLNEVFSAEYTLKYSSSFHGNIQYAWVFGETSIDSSSSSSTIQTFHNASSVTIRLTVTNEVSAVSTSQVVTVHPSAQDIKLKQDGQSYQVQTPVTLSLMAADFAALPTEGVTYHWDTGEGPEKTSAGPTISFQYSTMGTKVVKVYSVSNNDDTTINHVVSGAVHIYAAISSIISEHNTGTIQDSSSVNFTITDGQGAAYIGAVTVLLSDNTNNDWAYNNHMFYVSDGSLGLPLFPLPKFTVYKITVTLFNPVSSVSTQLELSRVKDVALSVILTLEWVGSPGDTNTSEWEQQVEESVANQIQERFHFESWRLSVELTIEQDQPYSVHIKLLPNNNTEIGTQDLMQSLSQIKEYFLTEGEVPIQGTEANIPVISSQISDGTTNTVHVYTLLGLSVGVPILVLLFIALTIPLIVCAGVYIRKYRKVSHAYSRLRQSRASNFLFTHDGMEDEDDEPPVSLKGKSKSGGQVKFSLDDNFGNSPAEPDI